MIVIDEYLKAINIDNQVIPACDMDLKIIKAFMASDHKRLAMPSIIKNIYGISEADLQAVSLRNKSAVVDSARKALSRTRNKLKDMVSQNWLFQISGDKYFYLSELDFIAYMLEREYNAKHFHNYIGNYITGTCGRFSHLEMAPTYFEKKFIDSEFN